MSQRYQLSFRSRVHYEEHEPGIPLRIALHAGGEDFECLACIDTGAAACLFQREVGETLGLDIEAGMPARFSTLTGLLQAFGHEVTMQVAGLTYQTTVYFAEFHGLPRNLLGKFGWLQQIRFGLVDYDEVIYLSDYNDPA
ncbi:MAG TPA: retropepsin-like aspartic protease [Blastocatellia bacterium]|jgi:hypothetical protein|nr:retropepsin-like aspartic protease [Blastocatellia bacterium]